MDSLNKSRENHKVEDRAQEITQNAAHNYEEMENMKKKLRDMETRIEKTKYILKRSSRVIE